MRPTATTAVVYWLVVTLSAFAYQAWASATSSFSISQQLCQWSTRPLVWGLVPFLFGLLIGHFQPSQHPARLGGAIFLASLGVVLGALLLGMI